MPPEGFVDVSRTRSPLVALLFAIAIAGAAPSARALPVPAVDLGQSLEPPRSLRASLFLDRDRLRGYGIERPARLAFDEDGALYVLDARARRIVRLSLFPPDGDRGRTGGAWTTGGGATAVYGDDAPASALPHDLALDLRGSLLVLDRSRATVAGYDRNASYLGTRDLDPALAEEARAPDSRLLRDPFGDLWLLAPRARDLTPLDARLGRKRQDRFLSPEDSLSEPVAAVFLPRGGGWIADRGARRLWRFDPTGRIRSGQDLAADDLAVDGSGSLYVADAAGSKIVVLDREGRVVQHRWLGGEERGWRPGAIAWSQQDKVAVADESRGEIWIFDVERGATP
jgi:hypothetical protein